jgi:hypothetical protein
MSTRPFGEPPDPPGPNIGLGAIEWGPEESMKSGRAHAAAEPEPANLFSEEAERSARDDKDAGLKLWTPEEESKVKTLLKPATKKVRSSSRGVNQPESSPKKARKRVRLLALTFVVVLSLLFVADLVYVGVGLQLQLRDAAGHLDEMQGNLESGKLKDARSNLDAAKTETEEAQALLQQPAFKLLRAIPIAKDEAASIGAVVKAAGLVAEAGKPGIRVASLLDYRGGTIGGNLYNEGRINLDLLAAAEPLLSNARDSLDAAAQEVNSAGHPLLPPLRSAIATAGDRVRDARVVAGHAVSLLHVLPRLTGGAGPRRYLLAFQALGEARATGGVVGLYGVLDANNGKLRLGRVQPYSNIVFNRVAPDLVPSWYQKAYGLQGALREWPQANLSPNFPVDARVMLEMYRQSTGELLDGVVAVDPVALSSLMQGTGSFDVPGFDETITAENVVRILSEDAYLAFDTKSQQNRFLARLVRTFWSRIETGTLDAQALAHGVGEAVTSQHLKIFVGGPDRIELQNLHADGSIQRFGSNLQAIFHNNYGVNKVDYYLHRTIETRVEVEAGGDLRVETRVELRNDAPTGEASDLLGGIDNDLAPGTNRMTLNFVTPTGAKMRRLIVDGRTLRPLVYSDSKHPTTWDVISIPPGAESVATLVYIVPRGASLGSEEGNLLFSFLPQPSLNVEDFTLTVVPPAGYTIDDPSVRDDSFMMHRELDAPLTVRVDFTRS